jgi:capsule biosynthesis phosphatase
MIRSEKCIVMDIDGTLCPIKKSDECYEGLPPNAEVVARLRQYHEQGFYIILFTSRNMRTFEANIGLILANTARSVFDWLALHQIPYDEIHFGKPWPGKGGFYVDDKAVRPDEFVQLGYERIQELIGHE